MSEVMGTIIEKDESKKQNQTEERKKQYIYIYY